MNAWWQLLASSSPGCQRDTLSVLERLKRNFVIGYRVDVSFRVLTDIILDSERVWVMWSGLVVGNARQWTIGGDSGGVGITARSDDSDPSVVGEEVVSRLRGSTGHDRRTILPLRSTPDPLALAVPPWVRGTVSCNHRSSSSLGERGKDKSCLKRVAFKYGDSRKDGGMGVGGGCAGMRRECLRVIVVVDIEKSSTSSTLPSMRLYICLTLQLSNLQFETFFQTILRQMIANSSTRRMQIAVSSNICGFLLLCLGSCSLVSMNVASVVLVDICSASVVDWGLVALKSSAVTWDSFSGDICDPNIFPAPHFFWSASSSRLGGSGSSSRLVCWQCGQLQSLDLVHKGSLTLSSYAKTW